MIVRALAKTEQCRDGNCPTAWLTDKGTVVVQGYEVAAGSPDLPGGLGAVEVPGRILVRAAAVIAPGSPSKAESAVTNVPGQRGAIGPAVVPTDGGTFVVRGGITSADVVELDVPEGEAAVEVSRDVIVHAVATLLSTIKEAV